MIVVFGSINLDLVARVPRLPRPGETLIGHSFSMSPGGKGANQALAARRAGAEVALFGAVGRDSFAEPALASLGADGIDLSGVRAVDEATGVALIHVDDHGENAITVIAGANAQTTAAQVPDHALTPATIVVTQLEVPIAEVDALARRAHAAGARLMLNAAPAAALASDLLGYIDVLIVNETEAKAIAGTLDLGMAPDAFVAEHRARFNANAIVSLGSEGLVASSPNGTITIAAPRVSIVDTVGAGDALVGAIAAALDRNVPWIRALKEGVAAGSLACMRSGAQPSVPFRNDIKTLADTI
jgi:ribokinase